jgi:hypothetical protein
MTHSAIALAVFQRGLSGGSAEVVAVESTAMIPGNSSGPTETQWSKPVLPGAPQEPETIRPACRCRMDVQKTFPRCWFTYGRVYGRTAWPIDCPRHDCGGPGIPVLLVNDGDTTGREVENSAGCPSARGMRVWCAAAAYCEPSALGRRIQNLM